MKAMLTKQSTFLTRWIFPIAAGVLGVFWRLYRLSYYSLTGDEIYTMRHGQYSLSVMLGRIYYLPIADAEIAPPLYFIFLNAWVHVFPGTALYGRLFSALLGIATLALFYFGTKGIFSDRVRLLALLFLAFHPFHVYYSQELRMYAFLTFMVTGSVLFQLQYLKGKQKKHLALYLFFSLCAIYTHYYFFLLLIIQNVAFLVYLRFYSDSTNKWRFLLRWLLWQLLLVVCFLPWIPALLNDFKVLSTSKAFRTPFNPLVLLYVYLKVAFFSIRGYLFPHLWLYGLLSLVTGVSLIGIVKRFRKERTIPFRIIYLLLAFVLPAILVVSVAFFKNTASRVHAFVQLTPVAALLFASAIDSWRNKMRIGLTICLVLGYSYILFSLNYSQDYVKPRVKDAAIYIRSKSTKETVVANLPFMIPCEADLPGSYHLWRYYLPEYKQVFFAKGNTEEEVWAAIRNSVKGRDAFWVTYHLFKPALPYVNKVCVLLERDFALASKKVFTSKITGYDIVVLRYKRLKTGSSRKRKPSSCYCFISNP